MPIRLPKKTLNTSQRRRGVSMLELSVAGVVVGMLATAVVQLVLVISNEHRALGKRHAAIQETASVMERISALAWPELTPDGVAELELSEELRQTLPEAELEIELTDAGTELDSKRITVTVRWPGGEARPDEKVRLVAWRYRTGDSQ